VVSSLTLRIDGKEVAIPRGAYEDFYDPQVQGTSPYIVENSKGMFLVFLLSVASGAAKVSLHFKDGEYKGRDIADK
jgi:hypothetical protein